MKHIKITNAKTGRIIEHDLTDDFIGFFIQDRIEKKKFGELERWIPISSASEFELSREDNRRIIDSIAEIHVPNDFYIEVTDITAAYEAEERRVALISEGRNSRLCSDEIADLIGGYNLSRSFTSEEIITLLSTFSTINEHLKNKMPRTAKPLIATIEVSEIVSQVLKDDIMAIFSKYGM
jgi:hypothetical protein